MPRTEIDDTFDRMENLRERGAVLQIFPEVHLDPRGSFAEILKFGAGTVPTSQKWILDSKWIRQINRSKSVSGVVRGMHTQKGSHCQGKLVEAVNRKIFDVIVDARPDSSTFGVSKVYALDPSTQNMIFVPRGFLHGFVVPFEYSNEKAIFSYYCDNTYDKASEITISPKTYLMKIVETGFAILDPEFVSTVEEHDLLYSEKDVSGIDYSEFMESVRREYEDREIVWYA